MKTVTVLLSTYNGASCLSTMMDSIFEQSHPVTRILIRDDGSQDGTRRILETYAAIHPEVTWYSGENVGAARSYFDLLHRAAEEAETPTDYYALCDQDDRWLPGRIAAGLALLGNEVASEEPALACSRPLLVNKAYQPIPVTRSIPEPKPSFGNALIENICTGCTALFNHALLVQAMAGGIPEQAVMHDWWLYLIASGNGTVRYDPKPQVLYRQHDDNEVGMAATRSGHFLGRARRLVRARGMSHLRAQTAELILLQGEYLSPEARALAEMFVRGQDRFVDRVRLAREKKIRRQSRSDDRMFRLMLLLGHYR